MFDDGALAVSLPAAGLAALKPKGSVFGADALDGADLSPPLARAIELIEAAAEVAGAEIKYVARPEIFLTPESLDWLKARLGGARRHLALSDGATVKTLPGFENHVFFYAPGRRADRAALAALRRRAPELIPTLASQVNTALDFGPGSPPPVAIEGIARTPAPASWYAIALDGEEIGDGARRMLAAGPRPPARLAELGLVALDEASLDDPAFRRFLGSELTRAHSGRGRGLALRLPETVDGATAIGDRLAAALAALKEGGARTPIAAAAGAWFIDGDAYPAEIAAAVDLVVPPSFDFWQAPRAAYRGFRSLTVRGGAYALGPEFPELVAALTGIEPQMAPGEAAP